MLKRNGKRFDKMLTTGNEEGYYNLQCPHWAAPHWGAGMLGHWGTGVPTHPGTAGHLPNIYSLFPAHQLDLDFSQVGNVSVTTVILLDPLQLKLALT